MNEKESEKNGRAQEVQQTLFQSAMKVTKYSNELPGSGSDWDYYQSYPAYASAMKEFGGRITNLMTKIYGHYGLTGKVGKLDLEEQMELVSDSNDVLMERINLSLDEAAGLKKQAETVVVEMMAKTSNINGSWNRHSVSSTTTYKLLSAKNILRPQLKFKEKIRNSPGPFVPKIKEKPHSLKPLAILLELNDLGDEEFSHPYEFELERFTPHPKFLTVADEVAPFSKVKDTPLVMVETEEALKSLINDLLMESVIAVDLEAHSYRSFQGITCLMQISTNKCDYIVDTLELWDHLQPLNEVFCNPKIVKIFHGADMDIQWLQRDFGIYVVNLFDTYQAAKLLGFAQLSLAFILRHYCQIVADKQYQLADWRIRPLPEQMVNYAREDTHYLGYIYEKMKKDLKVKGTGDNLLTAVWNNSRLVCLKRYRIPPITAESHIELYRLSKKIFNERQLYALKEIFAWRDRVAREEDESIGFVLPKHMMLQIADVLPREMQGILACCSPIPPLVRQHLLHLHEIILKAREMPLATLQRHGQPLAMPKLMPTPLEQDTEDPLHCMHDLTHSQDIRDDLPTLLNTDVIETLTSKSVHECNGVRVTVKDMPQARLFTETAESSISRKFTASFVSPYTRYMRVKVAQEITEANRVERLGQQSTEDVQQTEPEAKRDLEATKEEAEAVPRKKKKLPLKAQGLHKKKKLGDKRSVKRQAAAKASATANASNGEPDVAGEPSTSKKSSPEVKKKAKKNLKRNQAENAQAAIFEPFDYSQVDYHAFKRSALREDAEGRGRGRGRGRGGRGGGRGHSNKRIHRKSGQKSLTYSSK
ncbi:exosome component 10-like [Daphnia carinata]|uniref:exosome component 10-like n=1 Tax=Daphnia carinata TaxID=120202 RepID=UPI00257A61C1|nr:exosome component 10-like [Daphnia carinata]